MQLTLHTCTSKNSVERKVCSVSNKKQSNV